MRQMIAAEVFGTFCLVFAGTGALVSHELFNGTVTHVGIALTFGLIVLAMIYALGEISGCHLNPAVTLGFLVAGRMPIKRAFVYVIAQVVGGLAASATLRFLFPTSQLLGATLPGGTVFQAWGMEFILTLMLMVVILCVSSGAQEKGLLAGVAIGATIALEALFGGPVSGASMNPVRSLAPALVSGHLQDLWIYLTAPLAGALAGVGVCHLLHGPDGCCRPKASATI